MRWRWPSGFVCPVCAGEHHSFVKTRALYQCHTFRRQTSVIAGTIFAATKVPLCIRFRAMYHLHSEQGRHLQHRVGPPPWRHPDHRLEDQAQAHAGDDGAGRHKAPDGHIEIDDAYLGGERNGGMRGRGSPGKTPIVAAVETTPEGKPIRLKLRRVKGFRRAEIATLAQRNFHPASTVVSDGLHCFTGVDNAGCVHQPIITGSGRKAALNPAFKWVNTTLGNIKSAITGTYRTIRDKHVPRYLAEFEYRFNRRYDLAAMMPRLGYVAVRTPPMPYRLLKLAEDSA